MKNLLILIAFMFLGNSIIAQDKLFLVFEFMKVDNEQQAAYMETESFWEKIHQERTKSGDIIGWDLWSLQPGGENDGYQYLTVTLYNDPIKMMSSGGNFESALKAAYPKMSEEQLMSKFNNSAKSRDLAKRVILNKLPPQRVVLICH